MKDKGIDKGLLKDIETDNPFFKGFQSLRKLFWKYLNLLGVPFNDPCCPTASTATGGSSYLVYTASITQSGTNAPISNVLQNTLSATPVWSYNFIGVYDLILSNAFPSNKIYIPPFSLLDGFGGTWMPICDGAGVLVGYYTIVWSDSSTLKLLVRDTGSSLVELSSLIGITTLFLPEIRVYL